MILISVTPDSSPSVLNGTRRWCLAGESTVDLIEFQVHDWSLRQMIYITKGKTLIMSSCHARSLGKTGVPEKHKMYFELCPRVST